MSPGARTLLPSAALIALLITAPGEAAVPQKLPSAGVDPAPLSAPGASVEYVTERIPAATLVMARALGGGPVEARLLLDGPFAVPVVAVDGTASGLSADGRTLVLARPRQARAPAGFSQRAETTLAVLDTAPLRLRETLRLRGAFGFDAISPDGRTLYLVEYLSRRDPLRYAVRAYDLPTRRLLPEPIVDRRAAGELMAGVPLTRATSADGRWEYTLYEGREHPFVHALDTEGRRAFCIDLHDLMGRDLSGVGLVLGPGRLEVVDGDAPIARIDTRTLRVSDPPAPRPASPRPEDREGRTPWLLVVLPTLGLLALALAASRRRDLTRTAAPRARRVARRGAPARSRPARPPRRR